MSVVLILEHGDPIAELNFILRAHPPSDVVRIWYMGLDDDDKTAVDEEVQQRVSQISLIWDEMRQYLSRALSEWFDAFREEMRPVFDAFSEAAASATALLDEEE